MKKETNTKGPKFCRFFKPILQVLHKSGGSGTTSEIIDRVIEISGISEKEQEETIKNGTSRVRNQIQWARLYLVKIGYIDSSKRGVWSLTEKAKVLKPDNINSHDIFKNAQKLFQAEKGDNCEITSAAEADLTTDIISKCDDSIDLLNLIKSLSPAGFERLCQRLLRESGFEQVVVTGKSGDGGIDGTGVLQVNPFVSFNVLFQCKRYQGTVSPSQVRDFRGAMLGRADKGIIITTGSFSIEAKKEARRDGAPPIELVDGENLVKLFEKLELGLIARTTYDIDHKFFEEFK